MGMKRLLKSLVNGLATLLVLPALGLYRVSSYALGAGWAFPGWSEAFALIPGMFGVYLRGAFYRGVFPRCGADASIGFGSIFSHPTAEIGAGVYIGPYCVIGDVTVEDDVLISSHVSILNGGRQHGIERLDIPIREQPGTWPRLTIGRDTWIGERSVILSDVGEQCVVGAGSVVTCALGDRVVAVGAPARVIRTRTGVVEGRAFAGLRSPDESPAARANGDSCEGASDRQPC
jgi:acetyltransferase-like isoleucine patch superfamily enzyme